MSESKKRSTTKVHTVGGSVQVKYEPNSARGSKVTTHSVFTKKRQISGLESLGIIKFIVFTPHRVNFFSFLVWGDVFFGLLATSR